MDSKKSITKDNPTPNHMSRLREVMVQEIKLEFGVQEVEILGDNKMLKLQPVLKRKV